MVEIFPQTQTIFCHQYEAADLISDLWRMRYYVKKYDSDEKSDIITITAERKIKQDENIEIYRPKRVFMIPQIIDNRVTVDVKYQNATERWIKDQGYRILGTRNAQDNKITFLVRPIMLSQ